MLNLVNNRFRSGWFPANCKKCGSALLRLGTTNCGAKMAICKQKHHISAQDGKYIPIEDYCLSIEDKFLEWAFEK